MPTHIYILALENNCFYVGRSTNVKQRIKDHFSGKGSAWTKLHKPIGVVKIIGAELNQAESMWTFHMMRQYSIHQVRGGSHVSVRLQPQQLKYLQRQIRNNADKCFICGKEGHFAKQCKQRLQLKKSHFNLKKHPIDKEQLVRKKSKNNESKINSKVPKKSKNKRKQQQEDNDNQSQSFYDESSYFDIDSQEFDSFWNDVSFEQQGLQDDLDDDSLDDDNPDDSLDDDSPDDDSSDDDSYDS